MEPLIQETKITKLNSFEKPYQSIYLFFHTKDIDAYMEDMEGEGSTKIDLLRPLFPVEERKRKRKKRIDLDDLILLIGKNEFRQGRIFSFS